MVWNTEEEGIAVTLMRDGTTVERRFSAEMKIGEAVRAVAREFGLSSVIVKDGADKEVTQNEADKTLGEIGQLSLYPKVQGASPCPPSPEVI